MFFILIQGKECSKKWSNIRDAYNRNKGKRLGTGSAASAKIQRNEAMSFLDEIVITNTRSARNIKISLFL